MDGGNQVSLRKSLLGLANNYDGDWGDIKPRLDNVRKAVFIELTTMYNDLGFWTNRNGWHGAKAQVPWVSFGTSTHRTSSFANSSTGEDDMINVYYFDKSMPRQGDVDLEGTFLFLNYQWTAKRRDIYLTLLPYAEGWLANSGPNWPAIFRPIKQEIRSKIAWLKDKGFSLDDRMNLEASSKTGSNMQHGYIAYVRYSIESVPGDNKLRDYLRNMMDAYISLVELPRE